MNGLILRFRAHRRGAIAMIFAIALVPLTLLVGLTVDYAFFIQARSQSAIAADAASTNAVRTATATFANDEAASPAVDPAIAAADGKSAGQTMGALWFYAEMGALPTAQTPTPSVNVGIGANGGTSGFTSSVSFAGSYPTLFGGLFHNTRSWGLNGQAGATSAFTYVEVLMLLDSSPSMLIGADTSDIQAMEQGSACVPSTMNTPLYIPWPYYEQYATDAAGNNIDPFAGGSNASLALQHYTVGMVGNVSDVANQTNPPKFISMNSSGVGYYPGTCASGYKGPFTPCAFACHTTNNTATFNGGSTAVSNDFLGLARSETKTVMTTQNGNSVPTTVPVQLRLDVLQAAAKNVVSSMQSSEQAQGQFAVGVYQFGTDVSALYPAPGGNGSVNGEASTNLASAATALTNLGPPAPVAGGGYDTYFPQSVSDLISGKLSNGTLSGGLSTAGNGQTAAMPKKNIFIVTDGMEDDPSAGGSYGEMTSVQAENGAIGGPTAVCAPLKTLGYTVYVLYIDYEPLPMETYLKEVDNSTTYVNQDYPAARNKTAQTYAENTATTSGYFPPGTTPVSPDVAALQACASAPADYFEAKNSAGIGNAMNLMLRSALSSAISVTQ